MNVEYIKCTVCGSLHVQRIGISSPKSQINYVCSIICLYKHRFFEHKNMMVYGINEDELNKINITLQLLNNKNN